MGLVNSCFFSLFVLFSDVPRPPPRRLLRRWLAALVKVRLLIVCLNTRIHFHIPQVLMKWYYVALLACIEEVGSINDTHTYWDIVAPGASIGLELSSNLMVLGFIGSKESSSSSLRQSVEVGDELVAVNGAVRTSHSHNCPMKTCLIMLSSPPGCCGQEFAHCFIPH